MLRQPQLHSSTAPQPGLTCMCVHLITSRVLHNTYTCSLTRSHTCTALQLPWATEAWALGCGMPCLRWRRRMMTADSTQCDTPKNLPHPRSPSQSVSFTLPLSLFLSPPSPHIFLYPSPSFSPSSMHADCGPIIALAPVLIALHLWKSLCGLLVLLYMFLFGTVIVTNVVLCIYFYSCLFERFFLKTYFLHTFFWQI